MPGFLKKLIVGEGGKLTHTPSFEDFSLGTAADAEEELSPKAASLAAAASAEKKDNPPPPSSSPLDRASAPGDLSHSPPSTPSPTPAAAKFSSSSASDLASEAVTKHPSGATVWGSVFHPGRWGHRRAAGEAQLPLGTKYYDNATAGDKTTWEEVVKSERLQTLAQLPRTRGADGGTEFVDAGQLRAALGPSEDVEQLIDAARDGCREGGDDGRVPFGTFVNLLRNS